MKVLLATDGSKQAEEAAELFAQFSHPITLAITILSVNPPLETHGPIELVDLIERDLEAERLRALEACQRIEQKFRGEDVRVESVVLGGHPGELIVNEAKSRDVDLIVIGANGHSLIDRILLGSVSDFVATHARCSVLIVRPARPHEPAHRGRNLCFAYDESEPSKFAIKALREFDWSRNTHIDVVSVMSLPFMYSEIPIEIDTEAIKTATAKMLAEGTQSLQELSPNVSSKLVESSHVGDAIVQFSNKMASDIIIMGNSGRGMVGRFFLGSASRYVLRHATCSVWLVRNKSQ